MANPDHYIDLINRYRKGKLSPDEQWELERWRLESQKNEDFFQIMTDDEKFGQWVGKELRSKKTVWDKIVGRAPELGHKQSTHFTQTMQRWKVVAAAAAAILLIVLGSWYYTYRKSVASRHLVILKPVTGSDLPPGTNKAILTLASNRTIILDSAITGEIATQGETKIVKTGANVLSYSEAAGRVDKGSLNSLATPRGGQYQLILPDGSRVWLNAATRIDYPAAFGDTERLVKLSGEAYFEITKSAVKPFRVRINDRANVEVLGTHFDIKAYQDEPQITTTLLEGRVRFSAAGAEELLKPGEQAVLGSYNKVSILDNVDVDNIIAWKNGMTSFYKADIREIMRAVSRWYDVDIEYQGTLHDKHFGGGIPRSANLSELLRVMKLNGIHCTLEGRKIIVSES